MDLLVQPKMNPALYLRDPEQTELGRKIIQNSIVLIDQQGFEAFTFKKLAGQIGTTEAGIYRYFENKHRLLMYLVAWYWGWLQYQIIFQTNNINDPTTRLKKVIHLLASSVEDDTSTHHVNERLLHHVVVSEGSKAYLTKHVDDDNKLHLFKPYKDLCMVLANVIKEIHPRYRFARSLATTIIEMAHFQNFFMKHLPALTDFGKTKKEEDIIAYLTDLVFSSLKKR